MKVNCVSQTSSFTGRIKPNDVSQRLAKILEESSKNLNAHTKNPDKNANICANSLQKVFGDDPKMSVLESAGESLIATSLSNTTVMSIPLRYTTILDSWSIYSSIL